MPAHGTIIVIKRDGTDGSHFRVTSTSCMIGRDMDCDIRIQLPNVSNFHCKIHVEEDGQIIISNLSDKNHTLLNGAALVGSCPLQHSDVFQLVDRCFRWESLLPTGKGAAIDKTNVVNGDVAPSEANQSAQDAARRVSFGPKTMPQGDTYRGMSTPTIYPSGKSLSFHSPADKYCGSPMVASSSSSSVGSLHRPRMGNAHRSLTREDVILEEESCSTPPTSAINAAVTPGGLSASGKKRSAASTGKRPHGRERQEENLEKIQSPASPDSKKIAALRTIHAAKLRESAAASPGRKKKKKTLAKSAKKKKALAKSAKKKKALAKSAKKTTPAKRNLMGSLTNGGTAEETPTSVASTGSSSAKEASGGRQLPRPVVSSIVSSLRRRALATVLHSPVVKAKRVSSFYGSKAGKVSAKLSVAGQEGNSASVTPPSASPMKATPVRQSAVKQSPALTRSSKKENSVMVSPSSAATSPLRSLRLSVSSDAGSSKSGPVPASPRSPAVSRRYSTPASRRKSVVPSATKSRRSSVVQSSLRARAILASAHQRASMSGLGGDVPTSVSPPIEVGLSSPSTSKFPATLDRSSRSGSGASPSSPVPTVKRRGRPSLQSSGDGSPSSVRAATPVCRQPSRSFGAAVSPPAASADRSSRKSILTRASASSSRGSASPGRRSFRDSDVSFASPVLSGKRLGRLSLHSQASALSTPDSSGVGSFDLSKYRTPKFAKDYFISPLTATKTKRSPSFAMERMMRDRQLAGGSETKSSPRRSRSSSVRQSLASSRSATTRASSVPAPPQKKKKSSPGPGYVDVFGLKRLMRSPQKTPNHGLEDVFGLRRLMGSPVKSPKADYSNVEGVKRLMASPTPPRSSLTPAVEQKGNSSTSKARSAVALQARRAKAASTPAAGYPKEVSVTPSRSTRSTRSTQIEGDSVIAAPLGLSASPTKTPRSVKLASRKKATPGTGSGIAAGKNAVSTPDATNLKEVFVTPSLGTRSTRSKPVDDGSVVTTPGGLRASVKKAPRSAKPASEKVVAQDTSLSKKTTRGSNLKSAKGAPRQHEEPELDVGRLHRRVVESLVSPSRKGSDTLAGRKKSLSPVKNADVTPSPSKIARMTLSPTREADGVGQSPPKSAKRSLSPSKSAKRSLSPPKSAKRSLSPPRGAKRSLSPPKRTKRSLSPMKATVPILSPPKRARMSRSPSPLEVQRRSRLSSPLKEQRRSLSPSKIQKRNISPSKIQERSVSPSKIQERSVSPSKADGRSMSPRKRVSVSPVKTVSQKKTPLFAGRSSLSDGKRLGQSLMRLSLSKLSPTRLSLAASPSPKKRTSSGKSKTPTSFVAISATPLSAKVASPVAGSAKRLSASRLSSPKKRVSLTPVKTTPATRLSKSPVLARTTRGKGKIAAVVVEVVSLRSRKGRAARKVADTPLTLPVSPSPKRGPGRPPKTPKIDAHQILEEASVEPLKKNVRGRRKVAASPTDVSNSKNSSPTKESATLPKSQKGARKASSKSIDSSPVGTPKRPPSSPLKPVTGDNVVSPPAKRTTRRAATQVVHRTTSKLTTATPSKSPAPAKRGRLARKIGAASVDTPAVPASPAKRRAGRGAAVVDAVETTSVGDENQTPPLASRKKTAGRSKKATAREPIDMENSPPKPAARGRGRRAQPASPVASPLADKPSKSLRSKRGAKSSPPIGKSPVKRTTRSTRK